MPPKPSTKPTVTRAAIYVRISLDRKDGAGVKRQEDDCQALVAAQPGWELVKVYRDNSVTASKSAVKRPGYEQLLADIRAGKIDAVVAWDPDRLHRRPLELNEYIDLAESHRVATRTVNAGHWDLSTPAGRVQARIMGDLAAYEGEHKAERVRAAQLQATRAGKAVKRPYRPFGYAEDWVSVVPEEAGRIRQAAQHVLAGGSLHALHREWRDAGVRGPRGGEMLTTGIRQVLMNPRYAGIVTWNGEHLEGVTAEWEPILDRDTWDRVQAVLTDPARTVSSPGPRIRHLGTGIFQCACCGTTVRALNRAKGETGNTRYYFVRGKGAGHGTALADDLDEYVRDVVLTRLERTDIPRRLAELAEGADSGTRARLLADREGVQGRLVGLETRWVNGDVDDERFDRMNAQLKARLAELEAQLADTAGGDSPLSQLAGVDVWDWWESASVERRREVLKATVTVNIHKDHRRRVFYPETVTFSDWRV